YWIVGKRVRLRLVRQVRLHGMSELVRDGADVAVLAVVVDQHVRMYVVCAAVRIRARALAWSWIQVDPALVERAVRSRGVVAAERFERGHDVFLRFLRGVVEIDRGDERRIQIVVV